MNRQSTAKEALIEEALGDLALLLNRLEAVVPMVDATRQALQKSGDQIGREIAAFAPLMKSFTEVAKTETVKHVSRQIHETLASAHDAQLKVMQEAARELFKKEVDPVAHKVGVHLQELARLAQPRKVPWMPWLTHGAALVTGAALTWLVVVVFWFR